MIILELLQGVFTAKKKNGETYYRASITYRNKHISLGSCDNETDAHTLYIEANDILYNYTTLGIGDYNEYFVLSFEKWVSLINFRDNGIYFKTPIYLLPKYFLYCYSPDYILKFDADDLFYYSNHKIMKRGSHLFVADYGMQVSILQRYGIKNYSIPGKDYVFKNNDYTDFRYRNIEIINRYNGVFTEETKSLPIYISKIHVCGDWIIGRYSDEIEAAVAYNKAADLLNEAGINKNFARNYIESIESDEYKKIYDSIKIADKFYNIEKSMS